MSYPLGHHSNQEIIALSNRLPYIIISPLPLLRGTI